jgi:hypothetical protein
MNTDRIWIWFADNGNIRKWQREPFPEGAEYVATLSLPDQPDAARAGVRELDDDQIMEIIKEVAPWRDEPKLNDLLTYEKSPPLFPQATYDVPSYRATKFVRAVERRILSALVPEPSPAQADGLRAAIQWVEKRRDDYVAEHGSYDPETGATEFPGNGDEYVGELEEIIEGLEALRPAPKQFLATEDGEFNGNAPVQADERVVEALRDVILLAEAEHVCLVSWNSAGSGMNYDGIMERARKALSAQPQPAQADGWRDMSSAPKDGTPIIGWCVHDVEPYHDEKTGNLTDYGCHVEALGRVQDGPHILVWGGADSDYDEWSGKTLSWPDWWFRFGSEFEEAANPVAWMPLPATPTPAPAEGR